MPPGRMNPIMQPYSAAAIQEWERATSCKKRYHCLELKNRNADGLQ